MDPVNRSAVTPSKSKLARTFAKVMHIRSLAGDKVQKTKSLEKVKHDHHQRVTSENHQSKLFSQADEKFQNRTKLFNGEDEKLKNRAAMEAFLAKLFASLSSVKAAYAQLQYAQSPYDAEGIQSSDQAVVSELQNLSELKQAYLKKHLDDSAPERTLLLAEIQEQKSLLKTYEITRKKLDCQIQLKDSEIIFLREKLEDTKKENKMIDRRLNSSGPISPHENLQFSALSPTNFVAALKQTIKSIRNFVRFIIGEMEAAGWDLDAAASAIQPGVEYYNPNHRCYAFESFVCREMFDGFNYLNFFISGESTKEKEKRHQRSFFDEFMEVKSLKPKEYIGWKPTCTFAKFCWSKYLRLVHPKMESSLFSKLSQRSLVNAGKYPDTTFFGVYAEMAKRVWLLHCLAFSFEPEASVFQVSKGSRFSEVYMETVNEEAFCSRGSDPVVAFTIVPGFNIGKTVIQSQVYLS